MCGGLGGGVVLGSFSWYICYTHGLFMLLSEMHAPFKQPYFPNTASRQPFGCLEEACAS